MKKVLIYSTLLLSGAATTKAQVHRVYLPETGKHHYTASIVETESLITNNGFNYEGEAWSEGDAETGIPVYRVYSPAGAHHYTPDEGETAYLVDIGWSYEGIAWYATTESKGEPVYRVYNPNQGKHHYTFSEFEKNSLVNIGWNDEGIAWYSPVDKQNSQEENKKPLLIQNNTPYVNQNEWGYPNGCESFSLWMGLSLIGQTNGFNPAQIADFMPKVPLYGNPNLGFNGDPKTVATQVMTIYDAPFTEFAKRFAPNSENITGSDLNKFKEELQNGGTIVTWGTLKKLEEPKIIGQYYGKYRIANLHVFLVDGYSELSDKFHITDPIYGKFWVESSKLENSYYPNRMAVSIK